MLRRSSLIDSCPQPRESTDRVAAFSRQGAPLRTLLAVFAATLQICAASSVSADAAMRPNIVYILADDAGLADFGAFGGRLIRTPSIDRLASEGMRFDRHYAGSTVCAPSRSVLMTGQHSGHTRIRGNAWESLRDEDLTVAELLRSQGYATALIGKWGLGDHASPGAPDRQGFDYFFGYLDQVRAHRYYPEFLWRNRERVEYPNNPEVRTRYSHDEMTREALAFIERSQAGPFFLYLAYTIPHADLDVPADSMAPYHDTFAPETPFVWWRHPLDWSAYHYRAQLTPRAAYAGMISRLDRDVGRILDRLKALGLDERTIVMFASDNGRATEGGSAAASFRGDLPLRGFKRDLYEGGIRTPFVVRWPGKAAPGTVTDHLSAFQDLLPTLAELAGAPLPDAIDGISFASTLLGQPGRQVVHEHLYWEWRGELGRFGTAQAIRMGRWKLLRKKHWLRSPSVELYDLDADPGEERDLSAGQPELVVDLIARMDREHVASAEFPLAFYDE
jgi:arylsulfatase A-like enzyme